MGSPKKKNLSSDAMFLQLSEMLSGIKGLIHALTTTVDQLSNVMTDLSTRTTKVECLLQQKPPPCKCSSTYANVVVSKPTLCPPPDPRYLAFLGTRDYEERRKHQKDLPIVLVGMPEAQDEHLLTAIHNVLRNNAISPDTVIDAHRHGREKLPGQSRIVKVKLADRSLYKEIKVTLGRSDLCRYSRNDLTMTELLRDRELRSIAYQKNIDCGFRRYIVVDLDIVKCKVEKPLAGKMEEQYGTGANTDKVSQLIC